MNYILTRLRLWKIGKDAAAQLPKVFGKVTYVVKDGKLVKMSVKDDTLEKDILNFEVNRDGALV